MACSVSQIFDKMTDFRRSGLKTKRTQSGRQQALGGGYIGSLQRLGISCYERCQGKTAHRVDGCVRFQPLRDGPVLPGGADVPSRAHVTLSSLFSNMSHFLHLT